MRLNFASARHEPLHSGRAFEVANVRTTAIAIPTNPNQHHQPHPTHPRQARTNGMNTQARTHTRVLEMS